MSNELFNREDPMVSAHPAWMEIDLAALEANFHQVQRLVGQDTEIIASLKANAYGHGIVELARVLTQLGVYSITTGSFRDALALRNAGLDVKIQMFAGNLPEGIEQMLRHDLIPTVYNMRTAEAVSKAARRLVPIYIKVDAGLGRLGIPVDQAEAFAHKVTALPNIFVEGIYTHLPFNDGAGRRWAQAQLRLFDDLVLRIEKGGLHIPVKQSLASSAIVSGLKSKCNAVCVGHLLYGGLSRVVPDVGDLSAFQPVLKSIKSRLIHVRNYSSEMNIGLGGSQIMKKGTSTGVIPVGLYDGYKSPTPGKKAMVLLQGQRVPVLNVTLEYTTLDLTGITNPKIGEVVVLYGKSEEQQISLKEVAESQGVGLLDVLTSFNGRLPYIYYKNDGNRTILRTCME